MKFNKLTYLDKIKHLKCKIDEIDLSDQFG